MDKMFITNVKILWDKMNLVFPQNPKSMQSEQIDAIGAKYNFVFPKAIGQFMCLFGRDYGVIFNGSDDSLDYADDIQATPSIIAVDRALDLSIFPKDIFILSSNGTQGFIFFYKKDAISMPDPPLYRWDFTDWRNNIIANSNSYKGVKMISDRFSEWVNSAAQKLLDREIY